jgi:hypothetical protein
LTFAPTSLSLNTVSLREVIISALWASFLRSVANWDVLVGSSAPGITFVTARDVLFRLPEARENVVVEQKRGVGEERLAAARQRWKEALRGRVASMDAALKLAPQEDPPTPATDGDDD